MIRSWRRTLFAGLALALALTACDRKEAAQQHKASDPVAVMLAPTKLQDVRRTVEVVGTLYGDEEATISAKVSGRITDIHKDVGDRLAPNEPLAQVDKTDYELTRNQQAMAVSETLSKLGVTKLPEKDFDPAKVPTVYRARLQVDNAKAKLDRARQVFDKNTGAMSEQEFADLQTSYEVAKSSYDVELLAAQSTLAQARSKQSELEIAIQRLADSTVRAPASPTGNSATTRPVGRYAVASRLVSVGEYVREGTPLFKLVADDPIKYRAMVPARFVADVKIGQNVLVSVNAYPQPFAGQIARISPQVDPVSRMFQIEVLVPNPNEKLQAGAFATGLVQTSLEKQVTFVPQQAIVSFAGVQKVFTVKDGKAVERTIETGTREGDYFEVVKGLKGVEPVVVSGATRLADGMPVTIKPTEAVETATTRPASARLAE